MVAHAYAFVRIHAEVDTKVDAGVGVFLRHFVEAVKAAGHPKEFRAVFMGVVGHAVIIAKDIG